MRPPLHISHPIILLLNAIKYPVVGLLRLVLSNYEKFVCFNNNCVLQLQRTPELLLLSAAITAKKKTHIRLG